MAGRKDRDAIYWDACVWIAYFGEEARKPGEMEGIQEDVDQFERGEIFIATSPILLAELVNLPAKLTSNQLDRLHRFFDRRDVIKISADIGVCRIAQKLRDFYFAQHAVDGLPTLGIADALHLAAAIQYRCAAFHTFDQNDSTKSSKPQRGLIPLSGNVGGYKLTIRKPQALQPRLQLVSPKTGEREVSNGPGKAAGGVSSS